MAGIVQLAAFCHVTPGAVYLIIPLRSAVRFQQDSISWVTQVAYFASFYQWRGRNICPSVRGTWRV